MNGYIPATDQSAQAIERFHTVCKRVLKADPTYFPRAAHRGRTIYFCTESCLDAFDADPERFYSAHSRPRK